MAPNRAELDAATVAVYLLVTLATVLRVAAPLAGGWLVWLTSLAGLAWSGAFALFAIHYAPLLVRPDARSRWIKTSSPQRSYSVHKSWAAQSSQTTRDDLSEAPRHGPARIPGDPCMFGASIRSVLRPRKVLTAPPETTVAHAARLMARRKMSAIMIVQGERLVGIFTERDAVHRVIARRRDPNATRLAEVMTPDPRSVAPGETFGYALLQMHEHGFRHMPVVEDGRPVGMVSARNALDPELEEFASEAERRKHIRRFAAS